MIDWIFPFLAVLVPLIGALTVALAGKTEKTAGMLAGGFGVITAITTLMLLTRISGDKGETYTWISVMGGDIEIGFTLDPLGVFVAMVAGVIGCLVVIYSYGYMKGTVAKGYSIARYYSIVLLFIGGMIGLALTDNLLILYVFWEVIGFCSYALIGYYYKDPKAVPAGTKAFIVTRIGDTGFLIAILALWMATGTFNIKTLITMAGNGNIDTMALNIAAFGVLLGAIGKSAQFPLHVWLPDAMEAPTPISALIHAATLVNAGVYLVARTYPIFVNVDTAWGSWVFWVAFIGSFTALLTAILALVEPDLKRVLAYSTVSQLGYMMAAVGLGAIAATGFHLVSHAIFKALLFLCAGAIIHTAGTRNMYEMGGMRKGMSFTFLAFMIGALALAGIPPLNGFWSKDLILAAAAEGGDVAGIIPLLFLGVTAILTALYTVRMVMLVFYGPRRNPNRVQDPVMSMKLPLAILAGAAIVSWGIYAYFTGLMQDYMMPQYGVEAHSLAELAEHTLSWLIIVPIIGILIFAWFIGTTTEHNEPFHRQWATTKKGSFIAFLRKGYYFDDAYLKVVGGLKGFAMKFRMLQTGDLNYNMWGTALAFIVLALVMFLHGGF
jgi:NADH-quinone oxidoreductase subunit L